MPASLPFSEISPKRRPAWERRQMILPVKNTSTKQPSQSNPILKGFGPRCAEEVKVSYFPNGPLYLIFLTWWEIYRLWQSLYLWEGPSPSAGGWAPLSLSSGLTVRTQTDRWRSQQLSSLRHTRCSNPRIRRPSSPDPTLTNTRVPRNSSILNPPSLLISPHRLPFPRCSISFTAMHLSLAASCFSSKPRGLDNEEKT